MENRLIQPEIDFDSDHREERPWITRRSADSSPEGNRENMLRVIALQERLPDLIIVPAHAMRAFARMPALTPAVAR